MADKGNQVGAKATNGSRIKTTDRIFISKEDGFLPPGTDGERLFAVAGGMMRCKFALPGDGDREITVNVPENILVNL